MRAVSLLLSLVMVVCALCWPDWRVAFLGYPIGTLFAALVEELRR